MKWISVKDKLPENCPDICEYDYVLVMSDMHDFPSYLVGIAQRREGKWEFMCCNEGVHSCTGSYEFDPNDITHWMTIPLDE